jgi:hypothetical protein
LIDLHVALRRVILVCILIKERKNTHFIDIFGGEGDIRPPIDLGVMLLAAIPPGPLLL